MPRPPSPCRPGSGMGPAGLTGTTGDIMGETRDHLEEHGGPGRVYCQEAQAWLIERCEFCRECGCGRCHEYCPDWEPNQPEAPDHG